MSSEELAAEARSQHSPELAPPHPAGNAAPHHARTQHAPCSESTSIRPSFNRASNGRGGFIMVAVSMVGNLPERRPSEPPGLRLVHELRRTGRR
jgi:hypothetical protein